MVHQGTCTCVPSCEPTLLFTGKPVFSIPQAVKHPVMLPGSSLKAHLSFLCLCSWNVAAVWYGMEPVSAPGMWQWCRLAQNLSLLLECGSGVIWHRTCLGSWNVAMVSSGTEPACSWNVAVVSSGTECVSAPGMWQWCCLAQNLSLLLECDSGVV